LPVSFEKNSKKKWQTKEEILDVIEKSNSVKKLEQRSFIEGFFAKENYKFTIDGNALTLMYNSNQDQLNWPCNEDCQDHDKEHHISTDSEWVSLHFSRII